MRRLMKFTYSE